MFYNVIMFEVIFLAAGLLILLPYLLVCQKDAPFVPLEPEIVGEVMRLAEIKKDDIFYDLGSGDGRLVIAAALRGAREAYGVELSPLRVAYSKLWLKFLRLKNAHIIKEDIFKVDLSRATVVSLYLLQETNDKLVEKLKRELKPKARVISIAFTLPGFKLLKVSPKGPIYGPVYLYKI